jgi:ATP-dependent RNA helicase RhlE
MRPQIDAVARGLDILVATPGRLLDLVNQRHIRFDSTAVLVLDEADRMLDMGFIRDVKKIVAALPKNRQTMLFSATMPNDVAHLAADVLNKPDRVEVARAGVTIDRIEQKVFMVEQQRKKSLLGDLLRDPQLSRVIVFTRTKRGANRVAEQLSDTGISADAIHGNKSQGARQRALEGFRAGHVRVLVATDIAARGIDVDGISHVINYELPNEPESYVHRIGRTARAGATGVAFSFCDPSEQASLRDIEKLTRQSITVIAGQSGTSSGRPSAGAPERAPSGQKPRRNKRRRHRGSGGELQRSPGRAAA